MNNIFIDKKVYALAPKKELVWVLPFIGKKSLHSRSELVKSAKNNLSFCNLKVVSQSRYKLRTLFRFEDALDKKICSNLVYRYLCSSWMLLIMVKLTNTFLQELENIWIFQIEQENVLKMWRSQYFLTTYYNVIAQLILAILIF